MNDDFEHECTSWMLFPKYTGGKRLLHKNRDADARGIVLYKSQPGVAHKWLAVGNDGKTNMVLNDCGLACVMNSGEATFENEEDVKGRMSTPRIAQDLAENCSTAAEAVARFKGIIAKRLYTHKRRGSIFFIMDTKTGYIVECTAHHVFPARVTGGMAIRANIWHNFGISRYSQNEPNSTLNSASREMQVRIGLNEALDKRGIITLQDIWRTTRMRGDEALMGNKSGVCNKRTNSAATIESDAEFPDVLSAIFVTIGPPAHTAYLPVPCCLSKVPKEIADGSWSAAAFERGDKFGLDFDDSIWLPLEDEMIKVFAAAQSSARELLRNGNRKEAIVLMNKAFDKCFKLANPLVLKKL